MLNRSLLTLTLLLAFATNTLLAEKICPSCDKTFDDSIKFCPQDGTKLNELSRSDVVIFEFKSLPEGATIRLNGDRVNKNNVSLKLGRTYKLEIEAEGYKNSLFVVSPQENGKIIVEPYMAFLSPEENRNIKINAIANVQYGDMIEIKAGVYSSSSYFPFVFSRKSFPCPISI